MIFDKKGHLYFPLWFIIIYEIGNGNNYGHKITKSTNTTYSGVSNIIKELVIKGYAISEKRGRTKFLTLTPRGIEVYDFMCKINRVLP